MYEVPGVSFCLSALAFQSVFSDLIALESLLLAPNPVGLFYTVVHNSKPQVCFSLLDLISLRIGMFSPQPNPGTLEINVSLHLSFHMEL
jgi:hypothetical protein